MRQERPNFRPSPTDSSGFPWLNLLLGLLAIGGVAFAFRERRRAAAAREEAALAAEQALRSADDAQRAAPQPKSAPAPKAPEPAEAPSEFITTRIPGLAPVRPVTQPDARAWIELEFRPQAAGATDIQASVQYELVVKNIGGAIARNIRIDARMFSAGPTQNEELAAFFATPVPRGIRQPLHDHAGARAEASGDGDLAAGSDARRPDAGPHALHPAGGVQRAL